LVINGASAFSALIHLVEWQKGGIKMSSLKLLREPTDPFQTIMQVFMYVCH